MNHPLLILRLAAVSLARLRRRRRAPSRSTANTPSTMPGRPRTDLRAHEAYNEASNMDAYQLLLLLAGHTERHVAQISEVKTDPAFPGR